MNSLKTFWHRLRSLTQKKTVKDEIDDELRFHVEQRTADNLAAGLSPDEAAREARKRFGNLQNTREECRDVCGTSFWETLFQDIRFGLRQLWKNPGFTLVAVLTLALGIGVNTAMFSLVNEVLLRSLPVKNPRDLVLFRTIEGKGGHMSHAGEDNGYSDPASGRWSSTSFSLLIFERFRAHESVLSDVFAFAPFSEISVLIDGQPEAGIHGQFVSGGYYAGLGVPVILGRTITPDDDRPAAEPVVVISHRYWLNRFGADRGVIGKVVQLNRVAATIIGVTPPGFAGTMQIGQSADITVPLAHHIRFQPAAGEGRAQSWYWWVRIMGRLAPHATPAQASASLQMTFQETAREGWLAGWPLHKESGRDMPEAPKLTADSGGQGENDKRREYTRPLSILMGLGSLVLAAACGNVANLLLARGAVRNREIALRFALGASRSRVVRQLLVESLLLALLGALIGTLLSYWSHGVLLALCPWAGSQSVLDLSLDARVFGFTIAAAVAATLLFGLAPAIRAARIDLNPISRGGARLLGAGARSRLSRGLMVVQIALSLVLLVSAGLFVRTLRNLQNVDAGFDRNQLVLFRIDAASAGYSSEQSKALQTHLQERLEGIPGVHEATFSHIALLDADRENRRVSVRDYTPAPGESMIFDLNGLAPNFFNAMQIPILQGRSFEDRDNAMAPKVAIVNQTFARKIFGKSNPIGRVFGFSATNASEIEIVGVVGDAKYGWLRGAAPATVYVPAAQDLRGAVNYSVRTVANPIAIMPAIRAAVREIDPTLPVINLRTQDEQMVRLNWQELLFARLSCCFGGVALGLSCAGLYGLISYQVARRTGEIGLRMALGAQSMQVLGMVLREALALVALGIALGVGAAYSTGRFIESILFGISSADPFTYVVVALILIVVALLASVLPACRAAKVDPMVALRHE